MPEQLILSYLIWYFLVSTFEKWAYKFYFLLQKWLFTSVSQQQYQDLIEQNTVLEGDTWGIKVLEKADNQIIKIFRLKRLRSSAYFYPYALRFKVNAWLLKRKGIDTVDTGKISYCRAEQRHLLNYYKIPGQPIDDLLKQKPLDHRLVQQLIDYIALLHNKGIYFRSLHFGNIIVKPDGRFALIDITDTQFKLSKLSLRQSIRNWKHLMKYDFERSVIEDYGWDAFFNEYAEKVGFSSAQVATLTKALT